MPLLQPIYELVAGIETQSRMTLKLAGLNHKEPKEVSFPETGNPGGGEVSLFCLVLFESGK